MKMKGSHLVGRVAPHIAIRNAALALTARVMPLGCTNVAALEKDRGFAARHKLAHEMAGLSLLADIPHTTLELWDRQGEGSLAAYDGSTNTLRMIKIKAVVPGTVIVGGRMEPRCVVITEEGEMLLPPRTVVVLR